MANSEPWLDIATRFGLPVAMLVVLALYHIRVIRDYNLVIKEKDAEIKRIGDLRVQESRDSSNTLLEQGRAIQHGLGETNKTLTLILERERRGTRKTQ